MCLTSQVGGLKQEVMEGEQRYHLLGCALGLTDAAIRRVSAGPAAERMRALYQQKVCRGNELILL